MKVFLVHQFNDCDEWDTLSVHRTEHSANARVDKLAAENGFDALDKERYYWVEEMALQD